MMKKLTLTLTRLLLVALCVAPPAALAQSAEDRLRLENLSLRIRIMELQGELSVYVTRELLNQRDALKANALKNKIDVGKNKPTKEETNTEK